MLSLIFEPKKEEISGGWGKVCKEKPYMWAAPKVMPPIYFHGNYNRYKEHNNTI
jgi:hypothetical protein